MYIDYYLKKVIFFEFNDWKNASSLISGHETSEEQNNYMQNYLKRKKEGKIDCDLLEQF